MAYLPIFCAQDQATALGQTPGLSGVKQTQGRKLTPGSSEGRGRPPKRINLNPSPNRASADSRIQMRVTLVQLQLMALAYVFGSWKPKTSEQ